MCRLWPAFGLLLAVVLNGAAAARFPSCMTSSVKDDLKLFHLRNCSGEKMNVKIIGDYLDIIVEPTKVDGAKFAVSIGGCALAFERNGTGVNQAFYVRESEHSAVKVPDTVLFTLYSNGSDDLWSKNPVHAWCKGTSKTRPAGKFVFRTTIIFEGDVNNTLTLDVIPRSFPDDESEPLRTTTTTITTTTTTTHKPTTTTPTTTTTSTSTSTSTSTTTTARPTTPTLRTTTANTNDSAVGPRKHKKGGKAGWLLWLIVGLLVLLLLLALAAIGGVLFFLKKRKAKAAAKKAARADQTNVTQTMAEPGATQEADGRPKRVDTYAMAMDGAAGANKTAGNNSVVKSVQADVKLTPTPNATP